MTRINKCFGLTAVALTLSGIAFAQTEVPNTFQAGQPARAAEVNANFDALESEIDANGGDIANNVTAIQTNSSSIAAISSVGGVGVYSDGVRFGTFVTGSWVLSSQGYLFEMGLYGGERGAAGYLTTPTSVYYSEPNCQGRAFIVRPNSFPTPLGVVFKVSQEPPIIAYYTPRGTSDFIENQLTESELVNGCQTRTETQAEVYEIFPNDPAITGVSETPPAGAIQLGLP